MFVADDMGLGKTLTMISLVMKDCQNQTGVEDAKPQWLDKGTFNTSIGLFFSSSYFM